MQSGRHLISTQAEAERLLKEQAEAEAKKSDEADRLAAEAAKAKASSDEAAKEAEEKAEEAEEAVERETEGEGILPAARNIGLGAVEQLGGVQRSVQHRSRSPQPPTSPYAGAEAYTLAYSGAPPSQILAGAPPPLPPPVRNPTGPTSARENALEARELALEERLRYVEACVEIKIRGAFVLISSRRPPRHRRDACSIAWRCRFRYGTTTLSRSSTRNTSTRCGPRRA